jgi:hypothetical protein
MVEYIPWLDKDFVSFLDRYTRQVQLLHFTEVARKSFSMKQTRNPLKEVGDNCNGSECTDRNSRHWTHDREQKYRKKDVAQLKGSLGATRATWFASSPDLDP